MAFKDHLRKKIGIDGLVRRIRASWGPPDSERRVDKDLVRKLLGEGDYEKIIARDMELYRLPILGDLPRLLVLDNDLPIYKTSVEDVVLRKSPLVKEMLNIRNVIKILNDADVVISKKEDSLETLRKELIAGLDLCFTREDIDDLVYDGCSALENRYAEGVQEILRLFAELLGYVSAPEALAIPHHTILGREAVGGRDQFGPLVLYDPMHSSLKYLRQAIHLHAPEDMAAYEAVASGAAEADENEQDVFKALGREVRAAGGV